MKRMKKRLVALLLMCTTTAGTTLGQQTGEPAPDFTGQTLTDEAIQLSDYAGRVVLLDFWASWCSPCREEMPFLIDLYHEHRDDAFEVIAINVDTDLENMQAFLADLGVEVPFTLVTDPEATIPPKYDLEGMPTTVLVDTSGVVRFRHTGFRKKDRALYRAEVKTLLNEQ